MLTTKIYWNVKGHTKRMCFGDDLLDGWYWPEDDYNNGTELFIWINPSLIGRQWFEADINVAHRAHATPGKRHFKKADGEWIVIPCILPHHDIFGHVGKDDTYTLHITHYNRPFHELSSDIIKSCIDGFAIGRQKFMEIFRNENVGCT